MKQSIFFKSVGLGYAHTVITKSSVFQKGYRAPPCILQHQSPRNPVKVAYEVDYPGLILKHSIRIKAHLQRILPPTPIRVLFHSLII